MPHKKFFQPQLHFAYLFSAFLIIINLACSESVRNPAFTVISPKTESVQVVEKPEPSLDSSDYKKRFLALNAADSIGKWSKLEPYYPNMGAILPFKRVVAYYGNFFSKRMGILGELPEDEMLDSLRSEAKKWELADSETPVLPAIHYIAVTAQQSPGKGEKYRQRMPFSQIEKALAMAKKVDGILILDIQVGHSTLQEELPQLDTFLSMPNVHLGIDPEFSMKSGVRPGKRIGTFDAEDVNYATKYLAGLVKLYNLPPKILIVHRFTKPMVTNYEDINLVPEVQIVMQMDGWGGKAKKKGTYKQVIYSEPVQFTGFKVFYKNDTKHSKSAVEMQPEEILQLTPKPIYIQYQ
ncbi:MAG: hypothetical protein GC192_19215 [Bacteroidetes bacterium]|nr:hypothetical protein [Bacteroidota bacterium]